MKIRSNLGESDCILYWIKIKFTEKQFYGLDWIAIKENNLYIMIA